jgi:hypothetical protein
MMSLGDPLNVSRLNAPFSCKKAEIGRREFTQHLRADGVGFAPAEMDVEIKIGHE